jgi:hypothetical protein
MKLCTWLRWKGARNQRNNKEWVKRVFAQNEVPYTCLKNTQATGPDGKLVSPECCGPHRVCFVEYRSPKS